MDIWNAIPEQNDEMMAPSDFVPKNKEDNKIVIKKYASKTGNLISFNKNKLEEKTVCLDDGIEVSGDFCIMSGNIDDIKKNDKNIISLTLKDTKENQYTFCVNKEDSFYEKVALLQLGDRVTVLMLNEKCLMLKLGPVKGYVAFCLNDSKKTYVSSEFRVY